jgi:hypothetical protein
MAARTQAAAHSAKPGLSASSPIAEKVTPSTVRQSLRISAQEASFEGSWISRTRSQREVNASSTASAEVAGRDEGQLRVLFGELVQLNENRVGGAAHVDCTGVHAQFGPIDGERLDFIEQHHDPRGRLCDHLAEEFGDGPLALAQ